jgi:hypothetical protein
MRHVMDSYKVRFTLSSPITLMQMSVSSNLAPYSASDAGRDKCSPNHPDISAVVVYPVTHTDVFVQIPDLSQRTGRALNRKLMLVMPTPLLV